MEIHANEDKNRHNHIRLDAATLAISRFRERNEDEGALPWISELSKRRKLTSQDIAERVNQERGLHVTSKMSRTRGLRSDGGYSEGGLQRNSSLTTCAKILG